MPKHTTKKMKTKKKAMPKPKKMRKVRRSY